MDTNSMLESTEQSLLIIEKRNRLDIVVGMPHHAPAGVPSLPCPEHSDSDENTGFIGRYLADQLDCCSIIACNYTIDANKHLHSDYTMRIAGWRPSVLIEIHGHGKVRSKYDVEISCGSAELNTYSEDLATAINRRLSEDADLADVSVCGRFTDIYFKATKTLTITDARWLAYHIELSPRLRKPESGLTGKPTAFAYRFCDHLAGALREKHG
ncbi:MAG: hypothetical protein PVJ13_02490 [Desulfobacterales bacterium]|jgi:hypothetical protein